MLWNAFQYNDRSLSVFLILVVRMPQTRVLWDFVSHGACGADNSSRPHSFQKHTLWVSILLQLTEVSTLDELLLTVSGTTLGHGTDIQAKRLTADRCPLAVSIIAYYLWFSYSLIFFFLRMSYFSLLLKKKSVFKGSGLVKGEHSMEVLSLWRGNVR